MTAFAINSFLYESCISYSDDYLPKIWLSITFVSFKIDQKLIEVTQENYISVKIVLFKKQKQNINLKVCFNPTKKHARLNKNILN